MWEIMSEENLILWQHSLRSSLMQPSCRRKKPPKITVFPPKYARKTAGFRPPQETAAIASPVADLPLIGPKYAGCGKTADMAIEIRGHIRGISAKWRRITDFRMAPKSGRFAGFSGAG